MLRSSLLSTSALVAATALGFLGLQQPVHAETTTGTYVSLFAGVAQNRPLDTFIEFGMLYSIEFESSRGYALGIAVGWQFGNGIRGELEYSASRISPDAIVAGAVAIPGDFIDLNTQYLLANVWYDWDTGSQYKPYVGGGVGRGRVNGSIDAGGTLLGSPDTGTAYQLGVGFGVDVSQNMMLDVGYRYKTIRDIDFADGDSMGIFTDGTVHEHVLQLGMRFSF